MATRRTTIFATRTGCRGWKPPTTIIDEGPSLGPIVALVVIGLAVIAGGIFGIYWYKNRRSQIGGGALIAAQPGDYKVKPDEPGGMKVEGEGDTAFATSEGGATGNRPARST